jgi:hypothetical protein
MRYFVLVVSAVTFLASISASAAVRGDASQLAIAVAYNACPAYEGYPDCSNRDTYSGRVRARARA